MADLEHWRYFLTLEQDLERTTRFVEPVQANFRTFSTEFARLILATCSEVEIVAKVLCGKIGSTQKIENIDDFRHVILGKYPNFPAIKVHVPRFSLMMKPWKEWATGVNPGWWREHQQVKHQRHQFFGLAHFENAVFSLGGLFALLVYLYQPELFALKLHPEAQLLALETQPSTVIAGNYALPDFP
jgi:hypothetical protein